MFADTHVRLSSCANSDDAVPVSRKRPVRLTQTERSHLVLWNALLRVLVQRHWKHTSCEPVGHLQHIVFFCVAGNCRQLF